MTLLVSAIRDVMPETRNRDVSPSDAMSDLGANSVDRAEIVMIVLEEINLDVPLIETHGPRDLGELADRLQMLSLQGAAHKP